MGNSRRAGRWGVVLFITLLVFLLGSCMQMITVAWLSSFVDTDIEQARLSGLKLKFKVYAAIAVFSGISLLAMIFKYFHRKNTHKRS